MAKQIKNNITNDIADTLYIPLLMKSLESNKKNPISNDPFACEMVTKIDYDFSKYKNSTRSSVGVAIRSNYFDMLTANFIAQNKKPVVVQIGCGLDTRFQRLGQKFTDKVFMYESDLPEVIKLRKKLLPERENNTYISASMFETNWLDALKLKHPKADFLFVVEGVFMYFEEEQVKEVFLNITERFPGCKIIFDRVSKWLCKNSHKHDTVKNSNAVFKWGCDNDKTLEDWSEKLKLISSTRYSDFKEWRRAGILYWAIMNLVPLLKNSSKMLVYEVKK